MFKLNKDRIGLHQKIDSGASGYVYPYQKDPEDLKWVVKRIAVNDTDELLNSLPEIVLGFSCDHPCIVPLKGYFIEKRSEGDYFVYLKFPRMKENLKNKFEEHKRQKTRFSEEEIIRHFYALVSAVEYLHAKKIYHRDIKPANVLLDHNGNAKLSDIGVAKYIGEEETSQQFTDKKGTIDYTAPEVLQEKGKLTKENLRANDVWSVGLVMLELCVLERRTLNPYSSQKKLQEALEKLEKKLREVYGEKLIGLIMGLLKVDPNERMKIEDVKRILGEEYQNFEKKDSEQNILTEKLDRQKEKYKKAIQEMMALVVDLKEENKQLQKELRDHQSALKNQLQLFSDISKHFHATIEKLKAKSQCLSPEIVQKCPKDLEKKKILQMVEVEVKVLVFGSMGSGKYSFLHRLAKNAFPEDVSNSEKKMKNFEIKIATPEGKILKILFKRYDERLRALDDSDDDLYFGDTVVLLFYDITDKKSFYELVDKRNWVYGMLNRGATSFILGTKLDLGSQRKVSTYDVYEYATSLKAIEFEVSSKTEVNIKEFQEELTRVLLTKDWPSAKVEVLGEKSKEARGKKRTEKDEKKKSVFLEFLDNFTKNLLTD